jgi:hypothetical protein
MDHFEAIGRQRRLKESGALSEAEFAALQVTGEAQDQEPRECLEEA